MTIWYQIVILVAILVTCDHGVTTEGNHIQLKAKYSLEYDASTVI